MSTFYDLKRVRRQIIIVGPRDKETISVSRWKWKIKITMYPVDSDSSNFFLLLLPNFFGVETRE